MRDSLTVFCTPTAEHYVPVPALSSRMMVCGPMVETAGPGACESAERWCLKTPPGRFDLAEALSVLPPEAKPDAIVVWADASRLMEPFNLRSVPGQGPRVLIIGDTHHLKRPIGTLLEYALSQRFDAHVIVATRHHAHFFAEAGLANLFWLPSLLATPLVIPFNETRKPEVTFVGQMGPFHPRRRRLIEALKTRGYPVQALECSREEAARLYSESLIAFNVSLNGDLNFRPYEIPAAGGFLLTDRLGAQAGLDQLLREGEHYIAYDDFDDLCAKMDHYLEHPQDALAIARAGQRKYLSTLDRDELKRMFWRAVLEGNADPAFDLKHERRVGLRPATAPPNIFFHAALYEFFQEQHLRKERIDVLILPGADARLAMDIADLPRLRPHLLDGGSDGRIDAAFRDALVRAGVAVPPTIDGRAAESREWDVLVAPAHGALGAQVAQLANAYRFRHLVFPDLSGESLEAVQAAPAIHPDLGGWRDGLPIFSRFGWLERFESARGMPAVRRLHIGGMVRHPAWEVLNAVPGAHVDHVGNASDLSRFEDATFIAVYASHVLEHFDYKGSLDAALREWHRVLMPGGTLFVSVPDLGVLCRLYLEPSLGIADRFLIMRMMFGGHVDAHDYHLVGLDEEILTAYLEAAGFASVQRVSSFGIFDDTSRLMVNDVPISVNVVATKEEDWEAGRDDQRLLDRPSNGTPLPLDARSTPSALLTSAAELMHSGQFKRADSMYRAALAPLAPALHNLGATAMQAGAADAAVAFFRVACELAPGAASSWTAYGRMLLMAQHHAAASAAFERAIAVDDSAAEAHALLAIAHVAQAKLGEAAVHFQRAIDLAPNYAMPWKGLGSVRWQQGKLADAERAFSAFLTISPRDAEAWNALGIVLHDQGRSEEGRDAFERAIGMDPEASDAETNRLFYSNCSPVMPPEAIAMLHREWGERTRDRLKTVPRLHENTRQPNRRLRVGYVSADFNEHPVAFFVKPLFRQHDRQSFEVICFANGGAVDPVTRALRLRADGWHDIGSMRDDAVDDLIRRERIDILVDLAGQSSGSRLSVFAREPAPVRVTYLGYPNTTGLASVQYRITDAFADPPGTTEAWHVEKLVRPFSSFLCYEPPAGCPEVAPPPFQRNGRITFGSFNHFRKLNAATAALWSRILHGVPASRLLLKCRPLADETCRRIALGWFEQCGIASDRIELAVHQPSLEEHLRSYAAVDVALDTFPYNGTTTTCEALWMGVPVVTRAGSDHRSRVGLSLLKNAGLAHLAAENDDAFVSAAAELASDTEGLNALRRTLRSRLRASPLLDAAGFTRALESAFRDMWREWCAPECATSFRSEFSAIGPVQEEQACSR